MSVLFQLIDMGANQWISMIVWVGFFLVFFFFNTRLMLTQIMWKLERSARELEEISMKSKKFLLKEISKNSDQKTKDAVNRFFDFFVIEPVSLDTHGIVDKLDYVMKNQKDRFTQFVDEVVKDFDAERKACMEMGFAGGISLNQISKIVRHYVEVVKKTKNIQIAMILQMQLPMIEKIAKSLEKGTMSMTRMEPIGDSIGPMIAAKLIGKNKAKEIEEGTMFAKTTLNGRQLYILKAKGPGGRLGNVDKAIRKLVKAEKFTRIISIDAAAKLEGEKTGSVAEGVGVAMGGIGVERFYIEAAAIESKIPMDSIIVKMGQGQAITPMRKSIKDAVPEAIKALERSLERTKKGDKVIVVGVGNTSGVGNSEKDLESVYKWVENNEKKLKEEKKKKKSQDEDE